jgi:hypothetical protein
MRDRRMAAVVHAREVRADGLLPLLRLKIGDLGEDADAGVVDQDVEAAKPRDRAPMTSSTSLPSHVSPSGSTRPAATASSGAPRPDVTVQPVITTLAPS